MATLLYFHDKTIDDFISFYDDSELHVTSGGNTTCWEAKRIQELYKVMQNHFDKESVTISKETFSELRKYADIVSIMDDEEYKKLEKKYINEHNAFPF